MQIAIDAAGFSPAQADRLRRAMGAKRSPERMEELRPALMEGMAAHGIGAAVGEEIFAQLKSFADFGFPESHAFSFAHIVYASAWLKVHHPEEFYAALLAAQPMGFYSPASLVHDARRHGVRIAAPDVNSSELSARVARSEEPRVNPPVGAVVPLDVDPSSVLRLGFDSVRGLGAGGEKLLKAREEGPFKDLGDCARRASLSESEIVRLAKAGAFTSLGVSAREGVWAAGALGRPSWVQPFLPGTEVGGDAPGLPEMCEEEALRVQWDAMGLAVERHPLECARPHLRERGVMRASDLASEREGAVVSVAGIVTHRQRPHTARGTTFLSLEDETGLINVSCAKGMWEAHKSAGLFSQALEVRGRLQFGDGAINIEAHSLRPLSIPVPARSRDFR